VCGKVPAYFVALFLLQTLELYLLLSQVPFFLTVWIIPDQSTAMVLVDDGGGAAAVTPDKTRYCLHCNKKFQYLHKGHR
jgi:hypothetical protein